MTDKPISHASIGHNNPPLTPYERAANAVDNIYEEAELWLDGEKITTQEMADGVGKLMKTIRDVRKETDAARRVEVDPLNSLKDEIQARYNPLLKRADLAKQVCGKALAPWLEAQAKVKAEAARVAREDADAKAETARQAFRDSEVDDLAARAAAEALQDSAKSADIRAKITAKDTAKVATGGRAISLRTRLVPKLTDPIIAIRYLWSDHQDRFETLLTDIAREEIHSRGKREIPGFDIVEEKTVV